MICRKRQTFVLTTTPEGSCLIEVATQLAHAQQMTIEVKQTNLPHSFDADCGFQCLAWLIAVIHDQDMEHITDVMASRWRHLFVLHLASQSRGHQIIKSLSLGGAKTEPAEQHQLANLLSQHGVWPERVNERASQLMAKMSHATVRSILASPRPWQDLKAAANALAPAFKLIMTDELNAQIANRVNHRKYVKKATANPKRHDANKESPVIQAAELQVPHDVFVSMMEPSWDPWPFPK